MVRVKVKKNKIQLWLARKNLSQNWLAKRLNISSGYMSQVLTGTRCPSPKLREKILTTLDEDNFDRLFYLNK